MSLFKLLISGYGLSPLTFAAASELLLEVEAQTPNPKIGEVILLQTLHGQLGLGLFNSWYFVYIT